MLQEPGVTEQDLVRAERLITRLNDNIKSRPTSGLKAYALDRSDGKVVTIPKKGKRAAMEVKKFIRLFGENI